VFIFSHSQPIPKGRKLQHWCERCDGGHQEIFGKRKFMTGEKENRRQSIHCWFHNRNQPFPKTSPSSVAIATNRPMMCDICRRAEAVVCYNVDARPEKKGTCHRCLTCFETRTVSGLFDPFEFDVQGSQTNNTTYADFANFGLFQHELQKHRNRGKYNHCLKRLDRQRIQDTSRRKYKSCMKSASEEFLNVETRRLVLQCNEEMANMYRLWPLYSILSLRKSNLWWELFHKYHHHYRKAPKSIVSEDEALVLPWKLLVQKFKPLYKPPKPCLAYCYPQGQGEAYSAFKTRSLWIDAENLRRIIETPIRYRREMFANEIKTWKQLARCFRENDIDIAFFRDNIVKMFEEKEEACNTLKAQLEVLSKTEHFDSNLSLNAPTRYGMPIKQMYWKAYKYANNSPIHKGCKRWKKKSKMNAYSSRICLSRRHDLTQQVHDQLSEYFCHDDFQEEDDYDDYNYDY